LVLAAAGFERAHEHDDPARAGELAPELEVDDVFS